MKLYTLDRYDKLYTLIDNFISISYIHFIDMKLYTRYKYQVIYTYR